MPHPNVHAPERERDEAWRERLEHLADIIGSAMDAVITVDEGQRIVLFNHAAESVFRCSAVEAMGQPLERFIPTRFREEHLRHVLRFGESNVTGRRMGLLLVLYGLRADGEEFPFEATISRAEVGGRTLYTAILRDITDRQRAEDALARSEERFRSIVETTKELIWELDLEGRHTYCNPAVKHILGYAPEELVGENCLPLLHEDDRRMVEEMLPALLEESHGWEGLVLRWRHRDGSYRFLESNAVPIFEGGELVGFCGTDRDVTERRRAEDALRRSEAVLAQAERMAQLGAWEIVLTRSAEFNENPLLWSDQVYRIFGYEPGAVEPTNELFFRHVPPEERPRIEEAMAAALGGLQSYSLEHRIVRADGEERIVQEHAVVEADAGGRPLRVIGAVQDITERKRAAEALLRSEQQFRATFEQAAVGIAHVATDGRWLAVNRRLCDIVGYTKEELLNLSFQEITHPEDLDADLEQAARLLAGDIETYSLEKRYVRKDGSTVWINLTGSLVRDEATGTPLYFIAVVEEIEARKRAEAALRESREMFERAFAATPDPLVISRLSDGTVIEVNESWDSLFGIRRKDAIGKTSLELGLLVYPDERVRAVEALRRDGRVRDFEMTVLGREGERLTLLSIEPINIRGEQCLLTIVRDVTEQKRAELALRRLAEGFTTAREDVRRAIARELHDDASQNLSAVAVRLKLLEGKLSSGRASADDACGELSRLRETLEATQRNLRRMAHSLHPSTLEHFGLAEALRAFAREETEASGVSVTLDAPSTFPRLSRPVEVTLYRLAQEAVVNAVKHSGAGAVSVNLSVGAGLLTLRVADDGRGFDPGAANSGLGLFSMRERAEMIGGRLGVDSRPGAGTTVSLTAPALPPDAEGETLLLALPRPDTPADEREERE